MRGQQGAGGRAAGRVVDQQVQHAAELRAQRSKPTATPEEARAANAALRASMREQGNYFPDIEKAAASALERSGYAGWVGLEYNPSTSTTEESLSWMRGLGYA